MLTPRVIRLPEPTAGEGSSVVVRAQWRWWLRAPELPRARVPLRSQRRRSPDAEEHASM
jgi:hypothetical protein